MGRRRCDGPSRGTSRRPARTPGGTVGLLDSVMGMAGGGDRGKLVGTVAGLIEKAGGVQGLVGRFHGAGMGDKADSWVSTGRNEPVSPDEVRRALGDDQVREVARETGASEDQAASGLARFLPGIIDHLT
ncbi:MAG TPA: YidB family protein, partial [Miltoncostaeaceae bacterium]|nr:YidB family protein [Miltoncostaeaceae bacterium]